MQPPTTSDLVLLPSVLLFLGAALYVPFVLRAPITGHLSRTRFVGLFFLVVAFLSSLPPLVNLLNGETGFIYRRLVESRKILMLHFLMPALCVVAGAIVPFMEGRAKALISDDF